MPAIVLEENVLPAHAHHVRFASSRPEGQKNVIPKVGVFFRRDCAEKFRQFIGT